jgi:hypothetical protein
MKSKLVLEKLLVLYKSLIETDLDLKMQADISISNEVEMVLDIINTMCDIEKITE